MTKLPLSNLFPQFPSYSTSCYFCSYNSGGLDWDFVLGDRQMDPNPISTAAAASTSTEDADDWDTEGFVVPSILTGNSDSDAGTNPSVTPTDAPVNLTNPEANKIEEKIQLESDSPFQQQPHSGTSLDTSATTNASTSRKQKLKHKLREADKKSVVKTNGHENRIESLRELMGSGNQTNKSAAAIKESSRDWLDPHCHESEFDRRPS